MELEQAEYKQILETNAKLKDALNKRNKTLDEMKSRKETYENEVLIRNFINILNIFLD